MWHVNGKCKCHLSGIEVRIEVEAAKKTSHIQLVERTLEEKGERKAREGRGGGGQSSLATLHCLLCTVGSFARNFPGK